MSKNRVLNKTASIRVNDEIWAEFQKSSRELLGMSASGALMYLMQMFNLGGDTEGMADIVMSAITPMIRKGIALHGKEINEKYPLLEQEMKANLSAVIEKGIVGKKKVPKKKKDVTK